MDMLTHGWETIFSRGGCSVPLSPVFPVRCVSLIAMFYSWNSNTDDRMAEKLESTVRSKVDHHPSDLLRGWYFSEYTMIFDILMSMVDGLLTLFVSNLPADAETLRRMLILLYCAKMIGNTDALVNISRIRSRCSTRMLLIIFVYWIVRLSQCSLRNADS
jgi:hypothetical protein